MNDDVCVSSNFNQNDTTSATSNVETKNVIITTNSDFGVNQENLKNDNINLSVNNNNIINDNIINNENVVINDDSECIETVNTNLQNDPNSKNLLNSKNANHLINNNNNDKNNDLLDICTENLYTELIDDVIFGLLLQMHRAAKLGYLIYLDPDPDTELEKEYEILDETNIFGIYANSNESNKANSSGRNGQNQSSNNLLKQECCCPNCNRNIAATRFAPHLEKCMGMGRNSSRIATRRIANYNGDEIDQLIESTALIPNNRYHTLEPSSTSSFSNNNNSNHDDIMSTINAVVASNTNESLNIHVSSSCSSLIDVDASSSSSNCSISQISNSNNLLKPPAPKKKRLHNSKAASTSSMGPISVFHSTDNNSIINTNNLMGPNNNNNNNSQSSSTIKQVNFY